MSKLGRSVRRRLEREIRAPMAKGGDACTLCGQPFANRAITTGGATADGRAAVVGTCCADRLAYALTIGTFLDPARELSATLSCLAKRGGVEGLPMTLTLVATSWKRLDRAWFRAHPDRSHRLRPMFPEEAPTVLRGSALTECLPPHHAWWVVVRQIEPGQRVKLAFARHLDCSIPDVEAVVHALFDLVVDARQGEVLAAETLAELAERYARAATMKEGVH